MHATYNKTMFSKAFVSSNTLNIPLKMSELGSKLFYLFNICLLEMNMRMKAEQGFNQLSELQIVWYNHTDTINYPL